MMSLSNLDIKNYKNVSIICEGSTVIKINSFLLSSISPWLKSLIMEQALHNEITIICPDIRAVNVTNLVMAVESFMTENIILELTKQNPDTILPFYKLFDLTQHQNRLEFGWALLIPEQMIEHKEEFFI